MAGNDIDQSFAIVSLSISSQAFSKDRTSSFVFIFSSQTSITCFGIPPWSHGIWFTTDWKITIDHKTSRLNFHFLRKLARESESRVQRGMVKNLHPSGVSPFLWLTDPSPPSSSWPLLAEFKNSSFAFPSGASRPRAGWATPHCKCNGCRRATSWCKTVLGGICLFWVELDCNGRY